MPLPPTRYISAGPALPQADTRTAAATSEAMARMGNTIAQVGEEGFKIAEKVRKIEEAGKAASYFADIDERASKFANDLLTRTDPEKWGEDWRALNEEFKSGARGLGLSPEGAAQVDLQVQDWSTQRTIRFESLAAQRSAAEGKARIANALDRFTKRGDREGVARTLPLLEKAGFTPSEIEQVTRETDRTLNTYDIEADMDTDPILVMRQLEDPNFLAANPNLTIEDRRRLTKLAQQKTEERRSQSIDLFDVALMEGQLTPEDIDAAAFLTKKDKAVFKQALAKNDPPTNEAHAQAWQALDKLREARLDPSIDTTTYRRLWNEARGDVLSRIPADWRGDLKKELNYLDPTGRNAATTAGPLTREDLEAVGRGTAFRARDAGLFGRVDEDATPAQREKAYRRAEDIRLEIKRFTATNPPPTVEQVREFTDRLIAGQATTAAATQIQNTLPGSGMRFRLAPPTSPAPVPRQATPQAAPATQPPAPPRPLEPATDGAYSPLPNDEDGLGPVNPSALPPREQLRSLLSE